MNLADHFRKTNPQGVRVRSDGAGDLWAGEHRDELGHAFLMQDLDGFIGTMAFAKNTGDQLFAEYVPDGYENRGQSVRRFATVALFDRKRTIDSALSPVNVLTKAYFLSVCRALAMAQPASFPPKFFFVTGDKSPWCMTEVDINTGAVGQKWSVASGQWSQVWKAAGLVDLRKELERWLRVQSAVA